MKMTQRWGILVSFLACVAIHGAPALSVQKAASNQLSVSITDAGGKRFHIQSRSGAQADAAWINLDGSHNDSGGTNQYYFAMHPGLARLYRVKTDAPENHGGTVFDESRVAVIRFTVDPTNYSTLTNIVGGTSSLANNDGEYVPADMEFDGTLVANIGLRRKGNSSATRSASTNANYIPLKVDINKYVDSQKFKGLAKFNLHIASTSSGGSGIEDYLGYGVYRDFKYPSPRTGWAEVWLNGEFVGLYTLVEQLDAQFLKRWFEKTDGNLYKPESPAGTLEWRGTLFDAYTNANWDRGDDTNHTAFLNFVNVINNKTVSEYGEAMDVDGVLTYLAGNIAIGAWDNYTTLSHNFYLYEAAANRLTMLPWDMNDSMTAGTNLWQSAGLGGGGGGGAGGGMTNLPPGGMTNGLPGGMTNGLPGGMTNGLPGGMTNTLPGALGGGSHPLSEKLLSTNSPYRLRYLTIMRAILEGPGSKDSLANRIATAQTVLSNRLDAERLATLSTNIATRVDSLLRQIEDAESAAQR